MTSVHQNVFLYKGGTQKVPKNIVRASIDPSVRIIPSMAFKGCKLLTHVSFQEGLEEIKSFAFSDCLSLQEVKLPETTTIVGCGAFANCIAARYVFLNEGLMELHTSSFKGCSMIQHLCLPWTLNLLGKWAFAECKELKEVAIHDGLSKIDDSAFEDCDKLQVIGIPASVTVIGRRAIPETAIQERENVGIIWQQIYHTIHEMKRLERQEVEAVSPTNSAPFYDLTAARREIQGLNTDILEILDTNQKLQAQATILMEEQQALRSELNAMKQQNVETRTELRQTAQERDVLQQEVAVMNECLHVLKHGVEVLADKQQCQQQPSSLPRMVVAEEEAEQSSMYSCKSHTSSKKRSRFEFENTRKDSSSTMGTRIKRIFRGILWSSSEPKMEKQDTEGFDVEL